MVKMHTLKYIHGPPGPLCVCCVFFGYFILTGSILSSSPLAIITSVTYCDAILLSIIIISLWGEFSCYLWAFYPMRVLIFV